MTYYQQYFRELDKISFDDAQSGKQDFGHTDFTSKIFKL